MNPNDRIALVTGANRGIGKQVALDLASLGIRVVVGSRNLEEGKKTVEEIAAKGGFAQVQVLDVSDDLSIQSVFSFIKQTFGRLDILINNAGILLDRGTFLETNLRDLNQTFLTNVQGPFRLTQVFLPMMKEQNYGRIVNVSSGMGQLSEMGGGYPAYRISKAAINAITKIVSGEVSGQSIKINSVCPGWVKTDMGGPNASRSVQAGAETIVWAACLPAEGPTGKFFRDKKEIPW
ncbi:short chain dehydrogenase [Leptospira ryugenii]|uniref:Short chain dehydrogenase n=1 Tax=Leptospira ryugenii TaxID=1917863 RepID=A0A2P2E1S4_9LEPT|nr:SDR family oxidoreductase [Leptospira ryugenii]GBF50845.1 short chain dehydrogenase [Leptospira ryugenii]